MMDNATLDPRWEQRYRDEPRYRSFYPWTSVVSFVLGSAPRDRSRDAIGVLEIGCGTGNNVWFVAREGFKVAGVDGSPTAIAFAQERLAREGLAADLQVADFTATLPFADASFDLAFDRAALSFTTRAGAANCIREIHRVLKPGGLFQCTPYSDRDSSCYRKADADGTIADIKVGTITGGSKASFYGIDDVRSLFAVGWDILSMKHCEESEMARPERLVHCEWLVVARKMTAPGA